MTNGIEFTRPRGNNTPLTLPSETALPEKSWVSREIILDQPPEQCLSIVYSWGNNIPGLLTVNSAAWALLITSTYGSRILFYIRPREHYRRPGINLTVSAILSESSQSHASAWLFCGEQQLWLFFTTHNFLLSHTDFKTPALTKSCRRTLL